MEDKIDKEWSEGEIIKLMEDKVRTEDEAVRDWTKENLKEFEDIGKKFITKTLCWHEDATHNIRAVYTEDSRTTTWKKEKKKSN